MQSLLKSKFWGVAVLGAMLVPGSFSVSAQAHINDADTAGVRAEVQRVLKADRFNNIHVDTRANELVLSGQVALLADKLEAGKKAEKRTDGLALKNDIQVVVPEGISDQELFNKLAKKLAYDRAGYGTLTFNNLTLAVKNGVATVGGLVVTPTDKDTALAEVTNMRGIRDLVDHIEVAPLSPNDDRIRLAEANALYGYSPLQRYAINPAKPIRILVVNGHVTLVGVVDNEADRNLAGIRANGVSGVFSVQNKLQVQGQAQERIQ